MVHPLAGADLTDAPFLGLREVVVEYTGLAAHASASPFMGVNALDAVVAAYQGVSALRQHIPPTDRVHGVITQGGTRPNVVPEHAAAHFYLRAATVEALGELSQRVQRIFEGAAAMTGTRVAVRWDDCPPCLPVRSNDALAARFAQHLRRRGRTALPGSAAPDAAQGSTDLGNVSVRVPAIHPMLAIAPAGVALHTTDFAALVAGEAADRTVLDAAATSRARPRTSPRMRSCVPRWPTSSRRPVARSTWRSSSPRRRRPPDRSPHGVGPTRVSRPSPAPPAIAAPHRPRRTRSGRHVTTPETTTAADAPAPPTDVPPRPTCRLDRLTDATGEPRDASRTTPCSATNSAARPPVPRARNAGAARCGRAGTR